MTKTLATFQITNKSSNWKAKRDFSHVSPAAVHLRKLRSSDENSTLYISNHYDLSIFTLDLIDL